MGEAWEDPSQTRQRIPRLGLGVDHPSTTIFLVLSLLLDPLTLLLVQILVDPSFQLECGGTGNHEIAVGSVTHATILSCQLLKLIDGNENSSTVGTVIGIVDVDWDILLTIPIRPCQLLGIVTDLPAILGISHHDDVIGTKGP